MPRRLAPRSIALLGVALLAVSLLLGIISQALLGQQTSEALASIPLWALGVISWCQFSAQVLGLALVAVSIGLKALPPTSSNPPGSASREVQL